MTNQLRRSMFSGNGLSQNMPQSMAEARDPTTAEVTYSSDRQLDLVLDMQALQILDSSDDCIKVLDLEGRILFMSRSGQVLLGIQDMKPFLHTSWIEFWQGADQQAAREAIARAMAGEVYTFQGYCPTPSREPKWWECKVSPIRGIDGQVERLLCISRDITERRQIEDERKQAALSASEIKQAEEIVRRNGDRDAFLVTLSDALRPLTDASEIQAVAARVLGEYLGATRVIYIEVVSNGEEVIVQCNYTNSVAKLSGRYRLEDYRRNLMADHQAGRTQVVIDIPSNLKYTDAEKAKYREIDIAAHIDVPLIKNNQFVALLAAQQSTPRQWTEVEVNLVEETAERTWAAVERARAEAALRASEAKYRGLFESLDEGYFLADVIFDENDRPIDIFYLEANPAATRMVGQDFTERRLREIAPNYEAYWYEIFGRVAQTGLGERLEQYAEPDRKWYEFYVFKVGDANSRRVSVVFKEIAERKRQEANLALLAELAEAFSQLSTAQDIIQTVGAKLSAYLNLATCHLVEIDEAADQSRIFESWGVPEAPEIAGTYRISEFLTPEIHHALRAGETVAVSDTQNSSWVKADAYAPTGIRGFVTVPFHRFGEWKYLLSVTTLQVRNWQDDEIELIQELSNRLFPRLERARAEAALRESEARLVADLAGMQRLYDLYATLATGLDLKTALDEILAVACEFTHTDRGCVQLVSDDGTRLEMFTWHGYSDDSPFINYLRYEGFKEGCDRARVARQRFVIEETIGYPGLEGTEAGAAAYAEGIRATQSTLIINRSNETIGVLSTQFSQPHRPSDDELRLIDLLAWTAADFVERYQAHTALRESEQKYRSLFESIDEAYAVVEVMADDNGKWNDFLFLEVNPAFVKQTGMAYPVRRKASELLGTPNPRWAEVYGRVAETGEPIRFEESEATLGRVFDLYVFRLGGDGSRRVAVLFTNITERKQAEAAIAADLRDTQLLHDLSARLVSEGDIQTLYQEIVSAAITLTQADAGSIQALDESAQELVLIATQGIDRTVTDYFQRITARSVTSCGVVLATGKRVFVNFDVPESEDPDGSLRLHLNTGLICAQSTPLVSRSGKRIGMVSTHWRKHHRPSDRQLRFLDLLARQAADLIEQRQDAAQRKQLLEREQSAREEAERANRIKDEFLAVLSHELRSPLNPILGWSKLLQNGKLDPAKTAQALATIERNAKLQSELIEDLLDVSRILRGKLNLNVAPVNLAATIRGAMETVRLAAEAKSVQITASLAPDVGLVLGDPTRLQQVIWNLLSNAVKFTPERGQVNIQLERLDSSAQITVSDTGQGIAPDFLPYVFDYFRQADGATTRKFGGLGLGLAIVRHLVELHGGTVRADSLGEGQGATFTIRLPLLHTPSQASQDERSPQQSLDLSDIKILVVDDEPDTRDLVAFVLEQQGAQVTAATSAHEALLVLPQAKPDVLLSDIGMPEMDGYMLIQQVRALAPDQGGQIPAIALTAYAGDTNQQQVIAAGFQKHISKPIEPEVLVQIIIDLIHPNQLLQDGESGNWYCQIEQEAAGYL